ncbi:MAG: ribonuclease HI, partial [Proteobacteria bacterium]|nr:ribonuclease HI [Pseudomonadota bacterium]
AALEGIKQTPEGAEIVLTTDSQYVLKGITQWIKGWKKRGWKKSNGENVLNRKLWQLLDEECQVRNITWKWVRGHTGHPQNERCDELARAAISNSDS